jgi:hypothetical protein
MTHTAARDSLELEALTPSRSLLERRNIRNNAIYRTWCEETYGEVALGDETFHPADILDQLAPDAARRARIDALDQAYDDIEQGACERFPSIVAVPFQRFLEGPRAGITRLHQLRDTWESLIRLLAALALAEASTLAAGGCLRIRESAAQALRECKRRDLYSDKLAIRIGLIEAVLRWANEAPVSLTIAQVVPIEVLDEIRRMNSIRNGFSHEATKSDKQARELIEEAYPTVRDLFLDLRDLQEVNLFRIKSINPTGPVAEIERLFGHSQNQRIADFPLDAETLAIVLGAGKVGGLDRVLAGLDRRVIDLSPFIYASDDVSGHRTRLLEFKSKRDGKWHLECVSDSSQHALDANEHEQLLSRFSRLLNAEAARDRNEHD